MPDVFDDIAPDQKPPDAVVARGRDIFDEISPDPLPYRDYAAERPGIQRPIPEELKTDAQAEAERRAAYAPTFVNPRTGRPSYGTGGSGPISWATDWWKGAPEIVAGAEQLAGPTAFQFPGAAGAQAAIKATQGERVPLPMTREDFLADRQPGTRPVTSDDLLREAAGGAHQIIGGAFQLATPLIAGEMAANPVGTAVGLGTGMAAQEGVRAGLQALGLPEEYAEVAGDLAGVIVGAGSLSAYNRMLLRAKLRPYLQERMNMAYAQAQAYERAYRGGRLLEAGQPEAGEAAPAPGPAPAGGDIFDSIAPGGEPPAQLGEQARLLRGATPGEPGPVRQMGTGRFPGQPGEVIPQGPAYGMPRALPPVEDPGTPLGRVEKGLTRVQDLSEPELIEFMRQLDDRLKAAPPTPPQLPSAPPAAPNEQQEPSQGISPTSETETSYTEGKKQPWQMTSDEYLDSIGVKAGRQAIANAHKEHSLAVYDAISRGLDVPPEVLKEYPGAAQLGATPQILISREGDLARIDVKRGDLVLKSIHVPIPENQELLVNRAAQLGNYFGIDPSFIENRIALEQQQAREASRQEPEAQGEQAAPTEQPVPEGALTPQQALDQWGSLKKGQIIDTPEGPMTITRADAQNSREMPRISVTDQNGRGLVPSKKYVERWADESQWAPAPEPTPAPERQPEAAPEAPQEGEAERAEPTEQSEFGPVSRDFRHDNQGAVDHLKRQQTGEAIAALHDKTIGDLDLPWGMTDAQATEAGRKSGFGLAHIIEDHPETPGIEYQLQDILNAATDRRPHGSRMIISGPSGKLVASLNYLGKDKRWVVTAFDPAAQGKILGAPPAPKGGGALPPTAEPTTSSVTPPSAEVKDETVHFTPHKEGHYGPEGFVATLGDKQVVLRQHFNTGQYDVTEGKRTLNDDRMPLEAAKIFARNYLKGVKAPAPQARPEASEAEFQKAYNAELEQFRKGREHVYPSKQLMEDWANLQKNGAARINVVNERYKTSKITTEKRIEGKGKKRKEITSYIVDTEAAHGGSRRYQYDWEPDGSNDWAGAKALAQARGIPGNSNELHAAMMHQGEYVKYDERAYAARNALKAVMPGVRIPDISTAAKLPDEMTLKAAINLVGESLPRNLGDVPHVYSQGYSRGDKYYEDLREKLKPYVERAEAAKAVVGADHPRVLELEKLIEEKAREIDKAEAANAELDRARREAEAEKLKGLAERDTRRGARFGGEPGERLKEYAKAKGWKSEGDALQAQAEKHFGIKRNLLEPSDISGLKLKKHELDILREANLDPEGTVIPRRLTIGQAQELRAKGLIDEHATKLTEAGERAALAVRAADEAKQQGQPISEYKPGRGVVPAPGEGRFSITSAIPVKGGKYHDKGVWHTDGHFAAAGEPPKNWSEPTPGERNLPDIDRVIPKEPGAEVKPVGFGANGPGITKGTGKGADTLVYFSNRGAVNSVYYDYIQKRYAPDKWTSGGPKEPFQAWKDGKQVAVLMGMKVETLPPNIEKLMPAQPAEGMKSRPKKSEKGSLSTDLATLGLSKFITDDVVPTLKAAAAGMRVAHDNLLELLAPAARGTEAKLTALSTRANAAELARSTDRAQAALRVAGKFFDSQNPEDNYRFMERIEAGEPQPNEDLQAIADVMRKMLDTRREQIRGLGTGKLESFIENYFPHIWKEPEAWSQMWENLKKRPMEGSKSFLKKRTIDSISAGLERGLEPISDNPVDLVLMKSREMDKYLMAHRILKELKERGIARFLDAREFLPKGYAYIDDKIATVFGRPSVTAHESYDPHVMERLEQLAESLGIPHDRVTKLKSEGLAIKGKGIKTKFGSPESVLAHEIGHQLEWRYNLTARLKNLAKKQGVKGVAQELRDLADLRVEGLSAPPSYLEYIRDKDEKMANAIAALVYAPAKFQKTAPETWDLLRDELWHIPELKPLFDIEPSMVLKGRQAQIEIPGLVIKGHFVAPEPAATVLNNYLSPGWREKAAFRAYLGAANFLNQAQLGWSAFHAGFTTAEAMVSRFALGIYQAAKGSPLKGLRSMATTPVAPFSNVATGHRMVKEWQAFEPGENPWITQMVDAVVQAGGRAHMDQFYATRITENMMKAFRRGNIAGGVLRLPLAVMEQAARPIMEWLVPRQKLAAFADLASFELERLGPDASTDDVRAALARAWDSIDNRFGQLVYDNLFWDKVSKDVAMASVRSVGWNVGTIRELGGAVPDTAKFSTGKGDFTPRMAYMLALPVMGALMGAVLYYLWHGEAPKHLVDYYFPTDSRGQRWSLPTYVKDVYHWTHDPWKTAKGKIHPFLGLILDMLSNRDFANKPIRNPNHPLVKQAQEAAKHVVQTLVPLSVKNVQQNKQKGLQETVLPSFGITPAPKDISQPAAKQTRGGWGGAGAWGERPFPAF